MPYITNKDKLHLAGDQSSPGRYPATAGELTYALQQTILEYLETHGLRYQQIAEVLGSIEGAKLDFIERVVKPYEAKKREENGDVWPSSLTHHPTVLGGPGRMTPEGFEPFPTLP